MDKKTQIKISEISKVSKQRFKGISQETSGYIESVKCSTFFSKKNPCHQPCRAWHEMQLDENLKTRDC